MVRLVAWVSLHRVECCRTEPLHLKLPRAVTCKFLSTVFIESEDYLQQDNDIEHPTPNVDVQAIILHG